MLGVMGAGSIYKLLVDSKKFQNCVRLSVLLIVCCSFVYIYSYSLLYADHWCRIETLCISWKLHSFIFRFTTTLALSDFCFVSSQHFLSLFPPIHLSLLSPIYMNRYIAFVGTVWESILSYLAPMKTNQINLLSGEKHENSSHHHSVLVRDHIAGNFDACPLSPISIHPHSDYITKEKEIGNQKNTTTVKNEERDVSKKKNIKMTEEVVR